MIDIDYSVLPCQQPYRISIADTPSKDIGLQSKHLVWTNDLQLVWAEAEPGISVDWHTHMPGLYQVYVNLEGRMRWEYKDNDGAFQSIEAGPGEAIFIPRGFQNRLEILGNEYHRHIGIFPHAPIGRVEHFLTGGDYNTRDRAHEVGLWYDTVRDEVVSKTDVAVQQ